MRHLAIWIGLLLTAAQPCLAAAKPNVVLIMADDMGYADLGAFGCKEFKTPNRLAAGSWKTELENDPAATSCANIAAKLDGRRKRLSLPRPELLGEEMRRSSTHLLKTKQNI